MNRYRISVEIKIEEGLQELDPWVGILLRYGHHLPKSRCCYHGTA